MFESELLTQGFSTLLNNPQALLFATLGDAGYCDWRFAWSDSDHGCGDFAAFHLWHGACFWFVDDLRRLFGGVYGGSITAILLKIPGTPAAAATAIDGYELTKQGKAGLALSAATFSSFSGGTLSIIVLMFLSPVLCQLGAEI